MPTCFQIGSPESPRATAFALPFRPFDGSLGPSSFGPDSHTGVTSPGHALPPAYHNLPGQP